jgi:hypothetical protein
MGTEINQREYEFADITLIVNGRDIIGFRGIDYKSAQEKEALYGKGNRPMGIQKGNRSFEGSIKMTMNEVERLKQASGGDLMKVNAKATVCYGNPSQGDIMFTDHIYGIEFTEDAKSISQGDKFMEVTLPFICLHIQYQQ